jgi:predicted acylesterase/phospholipase RssA
MRQRAGIVITVDVDSRENMSPGFDEYPSPWKILWSRLLPWKKPIECPTVAEIMMATILTGCRKCAEAVKADADLSLEPPVRGVGILDFRCLEETAQQGYEYAMGALDRLPAGSPVRRFVDRAAPERGA